MLSRFPHRSALLAVAGTLAAAITLPSLFVGLVADDYLHRSYLLDHLQGRMTRGPWWDMFNSRVPVATEIPWGGLPWWSSPHLRVALLRPLATLSQYIDYALWPEQPALMHLHNIVLYAVIVLVASDLYARLLDRRATIWIATLLYAADDAHALGASWIASRNTLLTALFSLLTLALFQRARADRSRLAAWLCPAALLCAHASSEGAIGIWAYLLAYAAFLDPSPLAQRARALLPQLLVSLAWLGTSSALGYGIQGSGAYLDPRSHPLAFAEQLAVRLPALLLAQFGVTQELGSLLAPALLTAVHVTTVLLLSIGAVLAIRYWASRPTLRFLLVGCIGSLLPICAVGSIGRLFFVSGFGAHALIAELLAACLLPSMPFRGASLVRALGTLLTVTLACLALVGARFAPEWWKSAHQFFYRTALSLPRGEALQGSEIMVINTPDYLATPFVLLYRRLFAQPGPPFMQVLGVSTHAVRVFRPDNLSLELQPEGGYLQDDTSILVRPREERFEPGQTFDLFGAQVRVEATTPDGRPARIRILTFDITDPRLLWVVWDAVGKRYARVSIPAIGNALVLPAPTPSPDGRAGSH
jgi:hypothetical protein